MLHVEVRCFMATTHEEKQRPGAMWWAGTPDPGGRVLLCRMPDGQLVNVSLWQLAGEPPNVTATPSIRNTDHAGRETWHGFLQSGVLRGKVAEAGVATDA